MTNQKYQGKVNKIYFKLKSNLIKEKGSYWKVEIVTLV